MRLTATLSLVAALLAPVTAQTVDTIGGTTTATQRTNSSKASLFRIDSSVLLLDYEMYLNVPGQETLTFFLHRYHSRAGVYTLEWSQQVAVNGTGVGAAWYSTGPIALPLIEGNYYMIGVGWPGTLTYHYITSATNAPVSFGAWQRAMSPAHPVPVTYNIAAGHDSAMYHQRLTTVPFPNVDVVGTGCTSGTVIPRLVAAGVPTIGATKSLDVVSAAANSLAIVAVALGHTMVAPVPLFGCDLWLDLSAPMATTALITSATGIVSQPLSIPQDPAYLGLQLSAQAGVLSTGVDFTNALDLIVN
jgi:hypothetical protein